MQLGSIFHVSVIVIPFSWYECYVGYCFCDYAFKKAVSFKIFSAPSSHSFPQKARKNISTKTIGWKIRLRPMLVIFAIILLEFVWWMLWWTKDILCIHKGIICHLPITIHMLSVQVIICMDGLLPFDYFLGFNVVMDEYPTICYRMAFSSWHLYLFQSLELWILHCTCFWFMVWIATEICSLKRHYSKRQSESNHSPSASSVVPHTITIMD